MDAGFVLGILTGTFIGNFAFKKFVTKTKLKEALIVSAMGSTITGLLFIIIKLISNNI